MPSAPVPCIVVIRPTSAADPCLLRGPSGALFPRLLAALGRVPGIGPVFVSAPASTPQAMRGQLAEAGLDVVYSAEEFPQHRIRALMAEKGLAQALALTSYSYLLDAGEIAELRRLHGTDGDITCTEDGLALDQLVLVSRRGIDALVADNPTGPVIPPYFHEYAQKGSRNLVLRQLAQPHGRARRFLCELLLDPARGLLPVDDLRAHFEDTPPGRWLSRESHDRLLLRLAGASGFEELGRALERVDETFRLFVAKQVRFMRRLKPLAVPGAHFLELGFGASLLSSLCLLDTFGRGTAVEPFLLNPEHPRYSLDLFRCLSRHYPRTLPYAAGNGGAVPEKRLDVRPCTVDQAGLGPGSLDFCFSHVVFEHVKPVEEVSRELHRLLKPGGVMIHEIGLMDHTKNSNNIEFEFLRHSRQEWLARDETTNLWRVNDFVELWSGLGFDVDVIERHVRVVPPTSLHPSWSGYAEQDLYCYKALVRAVRR